MEHGSSFKNTLKEPITDWIERYSMRILFFGDIFARTGRTAIKQHLQTLKDNFKPDVLIVNGENAAAGTGITVKIVNELMEQGFDCITTGNHAFRQKDLLMQIDTMPKVLRPINYPTGTPGKGAYTHTLSDGRKILIANIMGQLNMYPSLNSPFEAADTLLAQNSLGTSVQAILIDFHAEITAEKVAFGHYLDGRVSAVLGTHTHIPTADDYILEKGTAYQTDVGMCGDYDSSIGTKKEIIIRRFINKLNNERFEPATGEASVCGTFIETDDTTGLATHVQAFQLGGKLKTRGISIK